MKKQYTNPTIEVIVLDEIDVMTASGEHSFDPSNVLGSSNYDSWY